MAGAKALTVPEYQAFVFGDYEERDRRPVVALKGNTARFVEEVHAGSRSFRSIRNERTRHGLTNEAMERSVIHQRPRVAESYVGSMKRTPTSLLRRPLLQLRAAGSCLCIGGAALGMLACSSGSRTAGALDAGGADAANDATTDSPVASSTGDASDSVDARSDGTTPADSSTSDASRDAALDDGGLDASVCVVPNPLNLVKNAGLDTDVSDWTAFPAPTGLQVSWNPHDAANCPTSGSLTVENQNDAGINSSVIQCIPVTAGTSYNFGGRVFVSSAGYLGQASLEVDWFSGANCHGTLSLGPDLIGTTYDTWENLSEPSLIAPAGTHSAQIELGIVQGHGTGFEALFDRIYLSSGGAQF
jgi:hypothetical protein